MSSCNSLTPQKFLQRAKELQIAERASCVYIVCSRQKSNISKKLNVTKIRSELLHVKGEYNLASNTVGHPTPRPIWSPSSCTAIYWRMRVCGNAPALPHTPKHARAHILVYHSHFHTFAQTLSPNWNVFPFTLNQITPIFLFQFCFRGLGTE